MEQTGPRLRLGFHYHTPAYLDEHQRIWIAGHQGRFLDSLAVLCREVVCFLHSPRADEAPFIDYRIEAPNIIWVDLGLHVSVPKRQLLAKRFVSPVAKWRDRLDALLIRGPSPLLPAAARAVGDLPVALLLVGDYVAGVNGLPQPRWRKEAIRLWSCWNQWQERRVAKHTLTFVNSRKLYEQLQPTVPHLVLTRTTTLTTEDFYERQDTCQSRPIHVLYAGRIVRGKGLLLIVQAIAALVSQGQDIIFDLVGWPEKGDPIEDEILRTAANLGIGQRVILHGFKTVGPDLFACYRQADIYVLASQDSEGFPRTIWEAMAHSVPVIATRVGGIPLLLQDGESALLIEPSDIAALVQALHKLITNTTLRQHLITEGITLARQNTLEQRAIELYEHLEAWVHSKHVRTDTMRQV